MQCAVMSECVTHRASLPRSLSPSVAESFPALQLTVAGFVVCLDPSLLAFLHHLPLGMLRPPPEGDPPTSSHHGTSSTASHSPTATPTPSVITEEEVGGTQERVNVLDILKVYAAKVCPQARRFLSTWTKAKVYVKAGVKMEPKI